MLSGRPSERCRAVLRRKDMGYAMMVTEE
jgi:hypothetical protein